MLTCSLLEKFPQLAGDSGIGFLLGTNLGAFLGGDVDLSGDKDGGGTGGLGGIELVDVLEDTEDDGEFLARFSACLVDVLLIGLLSESVKVEVASGTSLDML